MLPDLLVDHLLHESGLEYRELCALACASRTTLSLASVSLGLPVILNDRSGALGAVWANRALSASRSCKPTRLPQPKLEQEGKPLSWIERLET